MAKTKQTNKNDSRLQQLVDDYKNMLFIRRFEEKAGQFYGMGLIGGFCHLYIGQEAVVVGVQSVLHEGDCVTTSYRDHGHMLACGISANAVMAELTGRIGGLSKGKGGSMHMFSREKHFYGGHGIVGAQVPIGTGLAFALKYKNLSNISVTYMGDGAINQGQVYESFNMASLWSLPALYIIENNQYAMGTAVDRAKAPGVELAQRGYAYGIKGVQVDGMDVEAMRAITLEAREHIIKHQQPFIVEAKTYRYRGHSMSDPAKYRSKDEVDKMKRERDPIVRAKDILLETAFVTEDELKTIDKDIKKIVTESGEFAQSSPEPDNNELYTDVLMEVEA